MQSRVSPDQGWYNRPTARRYHHNGTPFERIRGAGQFGTSLDRSAMRARYNIIQGNNPRHRVGDISVWNRPENEARVTASYAGTTYINPKNRPRRKPSFWNSLFN